MRVTLRDWVELAGMAGVGFGVGFYDWRMALVVCGVIVLAYSLIGRLRS